LDDGHGNNVWLYHSSAKVLVRKDDSPNNSFVKVTPSVLKCLCGGLDAHDLVENDSLCQHSLNFMQALIQDAVLLNWTIYVEKPESTITKAVLQSLTK
jgi:hypothetical protein